MVTCVTLSKGRKLPCKGGQGGFKAVGFQVYNSQALITATTGSISTLPTGSIYRYELKNAGNTYSEEIVSDSETRSTNFNGTLNLVLQKLDVDTRNEIKMLTMGEVVPFIETYAGDVIVQGVANGAELTGGTIATGGAKADMSGYTLIFTSAEPEPYNILSPAGKTAYAALLVQGT